MTDIFIARRFLGELTREVARQFCINIGQEAVGKSATHSYRIYGTIQRNEYGSWVDIIVII